MESLLVKIFNDTFHMCIYNSLLTSSALEIFQVGMVVDEEVLTEYCHA